MMMLSGTEESAVIDRIPQLSCAALERAKTTIREEQSYYRYAMDVAQPHLPCKGNPQKTRP